jgi:hypothetical protein
VLCTKFRIKNYVIIILYWFIIDNTHAHTHTHTHKLGN